MWETNKQTNMIPFAVKTNGTSAQKTMFLDLYEKFIGDFTGRDTLCRQNGYDYLMFNNSDILHGKNDVDVSRYPIISVESAVLRLANATRFPSVTVQLNEEHVAEIQEDGSVTVGCSTFSKDAIQHLIAAVNSVTNQTNKTKGSK